MKQHDTADRTEPVTGTADAPPRPHRWSTGSRTCDGCGRDYDWSEEPCGVPLPPGDARRARQPRQLQHETGLNVGGPCTCCGLVYSWKTAYTPCFEEGDTLETWRARNPEAVGSADSEKPAVQP